MASFIISYDLPEDSDYQPLIERIKQYGTWAIVTEDSATIIRDALGALIPEGGRLMVVKSSNNAKRIRQLAI